MPALDDAIAPDHQQDLPLQPRDAILREFGAIPSAMLTRELNRQPIPNGTRPIELS